MRLYYAPSNNIHDNWWDGLFALATMRPGGFAGYVAADEARPAVVETEPVVWTGGHLRVAADADGGAIFVQIVRTDGSHIGTSEPVPGTVTDLPVVFGHDSPAVGAPVRLRFKLRGAKLFSFTAA